MRATLRSHRILFTLVLLVSAATTLSITEGTGNRISPSADVQAQQPVESSPKKLALLIGINTYKYPDRVSPLAGSLNDVEDMRNLLIGKFQFPPDNILVLKDSQATRAGIIEAIKGHLIAKAQQGDIVVLHYSGHGSQMKDATGTMISGIDETIVPYDSRDPEGKVFDISGADLHPLLAQLASKTSNLTFILDSCHSGTLIRGARVRSIPMDTRTPPPVSGTREVMSKPTEVTPKFAFLSAATSKESAFEHSVGGADHGAFTYFLTQELRTARAGATYRDVMDVVIGNVTANYPAEHPSLEGAQPDQHIFGDGSSIAKIYITAFPSTLNPSGVTLGAGQIEGVTVGSVYDVYPPGTKIFSPPNQPLARVKVASVDPQKSEASVLSGGKIAAGSRAREREHRYGSARLRVLVDGPENSPTLQSIKEALQRISYVEVTDRSTACNMQIRESGGKIMTLAADSSTLSAPIPIDAPSAADRVTDQVKLWAKWFRVLSIRNPDSDMQVRFTISGKQTRDPLAQVGKPDVGVREGDTVEASVQNNAERDVYIAMLDLSSDGSISVVYPTIEGEKDVLKPGLIFSKSFTTFVPKGRSTVTDILKIFASYKPIDLTVLTQPAIRAVSDDPLQQLLNDSVGESRGITEAGAKPLDLGSWTTTQRVLVVRR
jgi:hypothetical protein